MVVMANPGVAPLDPTSAVGKVRLTIGDVNYVALVPPVSGQGDYTMFSDAEIEQFLASGADSTNRAAGYAYLALSAQAALESKSIKDYDLQVDLTKRAGDLRDIAMMYFDLANQDDMGAEDAFIITPITRHRHCKCDPELAALRVCGCW